MELLPIYDHNDPVHKQALELFGNYVNCGAILCNENRNHAALYINDTLPQYLGYTREGFMEKHLRYVDCIHPEDRRYVQNTIAAALTKSEKYDLIYRVVCKDKSVVWIRENGKRLQSPDGEKLLFCLLVDISADMTTRQEIELQSKTDGLTGVLNRAGFIERMEKLLHETPRKNRHHAVIMMDIDRFKRVNDTFGHAFGDKVLEDAAKSLKTIIRAGDFVGRLGGDEFMLCFQDTSCDDTVTRRMQQLIQLLQKPLPHDSMLSCSMGVALYPEHGDTFSALYRCADIALYAAKAGGRNCFAIYSADMEKNAFETKNTPIDRQ